MPKTVSYEQYKKLKQWYAEQLKCKDNIIQKLREENEVVMKTALRQAQHTRHWQDIVTHLEKRKKTQ